MPRPVKFVVKPLHELHSMFNMPCYAVQDVMELVNSPDSACRSLLASRVLVGHC